MAIGVILGLSAAVVVWCISRARIALLKAQLASSEREHMAAVVDWENAKEAADKVEREAIILACTVASCENHEYCDGCKEDAAALRGRLMGDSRPPYFADHDHADCDHDDYSRYCEDCGDHHGGFCDAAVG